jgi:NAD(P)-dependent dehydrogenase (short-subunit alcohol dehydrogenase family)
MGNGRLAGKRALVTGASSGIGRGVAAALAREGAAVAAAGRDPDRTQRTVAEILASGGTAVAVTGDLSAVDDARSVVDATVRELGGLDTLVNNAGIDTTAWGKVADWEVEEFDRILGTNLRSPFLVSKFAIPQILRAGGGSIVHMSSVCAITVWAGDCGYDISKAGLNMLSDHISVEYGAEGIRSNTLMPGVIATELHHSVMASMEDDGAFEREILARHPVGTFGTVEDVAEACVFLCSDEAGFMTGANISIDGAYSRV